MAHLIPNLRPLESSKGVTYFKLPLHQIPPEQIQPNGDRYLVEVIDVEDTIQLGQMLVVVQPQQVNDKDPSADPQIENRGVIAGVVITAGNGHLLGLADHATVVYNEDDDGRDIPEMTRVPADVPMFYHPGDVVLIDRNSRGRALKIVNHEYRLVNQIDCLAKIDGVRLKRNDSGEWEQE